MKKEKVWKNAHLTFSIDFVCALEEFGKMGRRDDYIFLCTPQFSLTWPKLVHYICNKKSPIKHKA